MINSASKKLHAMEYKYFGSKEDIQDFQNDTGSYFSIYNQTQVQHILQDYRDNSQQIKKQLSLCGYHEGALVDGSVLYGKPFKTSEDLDKADANGSEAVVDTGTIMFSITEPVVDDYPNNLDQTEYLFSQDLPLYREVTEDDLPKLKQAILTYMAMGSDNDMARLVLMTYDVSNTKLSKELNVPIQTLNDICKNKKSIDDLPQKTFKQLLKIFHDKGFEHEYADNPNAPVGTEEKIYYFKGINTSKAIESYEKVHPLHVEYK